MSMNLVGRNPINATGRSFDVTVWSWRVLHALIDRASEAGSLAIDTKGWEHNDGLGLDSHYACSRLADALEALLPELGDTITAVPGKDHDRAERALCGVLGVQLEEGAYSMRRDVLVGFVDFLRACRGFRIY